MASTGPSAFAAAANAGAGVAWSNPSNALTSNDTYATADLADTDANQRLELTAPSGLSIPGGATIDGIQVAIHRKASLGVGPPDGGHINDATIQLIKGGVLHGNNKATGTAWPTTEGTATYGGASDLWGGTWTSSDFGAGFGIAIAADCVSDVGNVTASVDYAEVTVWYTASGRRKNAIMQLT